MSKASSAIKCWFRICDISFLIDPQCIPWRYLDLLSLYWIPLWYVFYYFFPSLVCHVYSLPVCISFSISFHFSFEQHLSQIQFLSIFHTHNHFHLPHLNNEISKVFILFKLSRCWNPKDILWKVDAFKFSITYLSYSWETRDTYFIGSRLVAILVLL